MKARGDYVFLTLDDGIQVTGDLKEVIEANPDIRSAILIWTFTSDYYTSNAGPFEGYVSVDDLDWEYSGQFGREEALAFANGYSCWDGEDFRIIPTHDGEAVLVGYHHVYDMECSWSDGCDHINGIQEGFDPSWLRRIRVDFDYETGTEYLLEVDL